jgi:Rod binding domain-containing protein
MSVAPLHAISSSAPTQFNAAALRIAAPDAQRTGVAKQFEAILVRQLLGKTMTSMLGGESGGVAGSVYGDMLSETMAQQLTAGRGLGLGRFIEQQLTPRGQAAENSTGATAGKSISETRPTAETKVHP